ncbi:protein-tyrosine phosphatase-like protein [Crassisporium funariophilum]|nr:protein-tyrosine phosphatase-like protein [Crassisporium funariophilum]
MSANSCKLPSWLTVAINSDKHLNNVQRVLAAREYKRLAARSASQRQAEAEEKPSSPSIASRSLAFLRQEVKPELVQHYSVVVASNDVNKGKNRYVDVQPYDRTRVVVRHGHTLPGTGESDGEWQGRYLNANWVLERSGHKWWIATQAPLRNTAHAFLSLLLQTDVRPPKQLLGLSTEEEPAQACRVRTVVQLTQNIESGRKKADAYFPGDVGKSIIVPSVYDGCRTPALKVTLIESTVIREAHCIQSTVSIEDNYGEARDDEEVIFKHMLYVSWPDHGVPDAEDRGSLLAFIQLVERTNRDVSHCSVHRGASPDHACSELDPDPPIMVGCSAGIGRTGSFIAISSLLRGVGFLPPPARPTSETAIPSSPLGPLPSEIKDDLVAQEVDSLREQRPGMVQRPEQVSLIYEVLADAFSQNS